MKVDLLRLECSGCGAPLPYPETEFSAKIICDYCGGVYYVQRDSQPVGIIMNNNHIGTMTYIGSSYSNPTNYTHSEYVTPNIAWR